MQLKLSLECALLEDLWFQLSTFSYCKRGKIDNPCRFGFPKPESPITHIEADHTIIYRRGVNDCMVNNYSPYLLATFRTNMDIQYNDGPQAVKYLAKYLAKDDYSTLVSLEKKGEQGYRQKSSFTKESDHLKARIISAVEATYDLLGRHKHANSRNVMFLNTGLYSYDSLRIRSDFRDLSEDSEDLFAKTNVMIYEEQNGADLLTLPQFFCFYVRESLAAKDNEEKSALEEMVNRQFYNRHLPKYVDSGKTRFVLRTRDKMAFWRTFNQIEMNGDSFYYQQIVFKKVIFKTTYHNAKGAHPTWKDYYEYLIRIPVEEGGIEPATARANISKIDDILDLDRGAKITKKELKIMLDNANKDQTNVYNYIKYELVTNSAVFVSGAAGTGKSYILRMFERYFRLKGFKVSAL